MSFEVRPLGVTCNLRCQYCYQNPERDANQPEHHYDMDLLLSKIEESAAPFTLFGGEPLLVPLSDLEKIWAVGLKKWGENHLQTNATLITDRHLDLFQKYRVAVGVSMDGPGALNDARWAGNLAKTRKQTRFSEEALERLRENHISTSMIVTLHRNNASSDKLPVLLAWLRYLDRLGIESTRLHLLEVDEVGVAEKYALSPSENLKALLAIEALEGQLDHMQLDVFGEMVEMLLGQDETASCVWRACDPYTTDAVQGLEGHGHSSNCGRTNKDGIGFEKAPVVGYERYLALYHTPQVYDGCEGCRFFLMCKGQCPGTGNHGDWRNRTADCSTWKKLFIHLEKRLVAHDQQPLSLHPFRATMEAMMLEAWSEGANPSLQAALVTLQGAMVAQQKKNENAQQVNPS